MKWKKNGILRLSVWAAALFVVVMASGYPAGGDDGTVRYPEGYRDWTHVKSMMIEKGHPLYDSFGGIHHIYANEKGLKALKEGRVFPDGSVLVFDLLEAREEGDAIVEGPRKVLGVMEKNAGRYRATGGWGFEAFKGDTRNRVVTDPINACFKCHEPQKHQDYTFSRYRR